jgi:hypothetical protein
MSLSQSPKGPAVHFLEVDRHTPNNARMYDYWLGGRDNFTADREAAEELLKIMPTFSVMANENRAFVRRAVQYVAETGVQQFLDIGSGLPTKVNVHDVALATNPCSRTVYCDYDRMVINHGWMLTKGKAQVAVIEGDLREPTSILANPRLSQFLDLGKPVCLLLTAVLHLVPDEFDPAAICQRLCDTVAPGSYVAISHITSDTLPDHTMRRIIRVSSRTSQCVTFRSKERIAELVKGFPLVEPGLVPVAEWRSTERDTRRLPIYAGVGRKP